MLLDVSLNYRHGFCCNSEPSNGRICGVYYLHTFGYVELVCLFYDNFLIVTTTAFTNTKFYRLSGSPYFLCLSSIYFIIFLLQGFHYHPFL